MGTVHFARWEEFIHELRKDPPESRIVHLTLSVLYTKKPSPNVTIVAWCATRNALIQFVHDTGDTRRSNGDAAKIGVLVDVWKKELEDLGYRVSPGRLRADGGRYE